MLITRSSKMNATRAWNGPPARQFEYAGQAACLDPIPRLGRPSVRISARLRRLFPRPTARLGIFIMSSIRELPMVFRWPPDSTAHGSRWLEINNLPGTNFRSRPGSVTVRCFPSRASNTTLWSAHSAKDPPSEQDGNDGAGHVPQRAGVRPFYA